MQEKEASQGSTLSLPETATPSTAGNESYNERFAAFLKHTNQKAITAHILESLLLQLKDKTAILSEDALSVLDVGCGEGTLAKQVVQALRKAYDGNIHYTGLDYNTSFVEKFEAALSVFPSVIVTAKQADAFSAEPFDIASANIALASHMIYHSYLPGDAETSHDKAQCFVTNIIGALKRDSVALMIHEAGNSDMRKLGTTYGSPLMPDAPATIGAIGKKEGVTLMTIPFDAELRFPTLKDKYWNLLKSSANHRLAKQISETNTALLLLGFVVQRDLAALEAEGKLGDFVEDVRSILEANGNNCLIVRSQIQVLLSQEKSLGFDNTVKECCERVTAGIPAIQKQHTLTQELSYAL